MVGNGRDVLCGVDRHSTDEAGFRWLRDVLAEDGYKRQVLISRAAQSGRRRVARIRRRGDQAAMQEPDMPQVMACEVHHVKHKKHGGTTSAAANGRHHEAAVAQFQHRTPVVPIATVYSAARSG